MQFLLDGNRIVHIAPGSPFGGVQKIAVDIAANQRSRGDDALLIWTGDGEQSIEFSERAGVPSFSAFGPIPLRFTTTAIQLRRLKPDIVHLHMAPPWIGPLLSQNGTLVVVHFHGRSDIGSTIQRRISNVLERILLAKADVLIATSNWAKSTWQEVYPSDNYFTVYNGIRMPSKPRPSDQRAVIETPILGMAGRLAADKGVHQFVEFAYKLNRRLPQVQFLVAGDGPERAILEEKAAPLIKCGVFQFLGFIEEMADFWSQLDLAVFTAPNDAFGLSLIEPVAYGVPAVAYMTGAGSDEIVERCRGIQAVPYGDCVALAELVADLLTDSSSRTHMIEAGLADIRAQFTMEKMAEGIDAAYEQAGARRRNAWA